MSLIWRGKSYREIRALMFEALLPLLNDLRVPCSPQSAVQAAELLLQEYRAAPKELTTYFLRRSLLLTARASYSAARHIALVNRLNKRMPKFIVADFNDL